MAALLELLVFILQSDGAVPEQLLLLGDHFCRLVGPEPERHVSCAGEDDLLGESPRVPHEDVSFLQASEVVEEVLIENTELGPLASTDVFLLVLPGDRAEVAELGDGLLEVAAVDVHVLHEARALLALTVVVIPGEVHSCLEVGLDRLQGDVLDEPARLHSVDVADIVVAPLEEVDSLGQSLLDVTEAARQDRAVATELFLLQRL